MVLVRTLREHGNAYGARYKKSPGDDYEHPDPAQLAEGRRRLVDILPDPPAPQAPERDPLDQDGDGRRGGSRRGAASTAAVGKRRRETRETR